MTRRRVTSHEECLQSIVRELKREAKESLAVWNKLNREQAIGRRAAFASIFFILKRQAEAHDISLMDLGLVDYEVPQLEE